MKNFLIGCIIILVFFSTRPTYQLLPAKKNGAQKNNIKRLGEKYKDWLDLTHYIITPTEKEVFLKLTNKRERDAFINLFWNLRDPSKGTPQNEFKQEHIKRFKYVNRYFKYGSPKPGWKTDRGKIYIILGPPVHKNEVITNGLHPVEIWEYYGGVQKGLPSAFKIVFYKPSGLGDYKIYIPAVDGPAALLSLSISEVDPYNYDKIYYKIHEIEPEVSEVAFSLIPGENLYRFRPSLRDTHLISQIYEIPYKNINAKYARNFLSFKGIVKVSSTTNYINNKGVIYILRDPLLKLNFVHLAIRPERISVEYLHEKDQYYCHFNLMIILKKMKNTILQYEKNFPLYFSKTELNQEISKGLIITDFFPVIEGEYKLIVILRNVIDDEIGFFENSIKTPVYNLSLPKLYNPIISYEITSIKQQNNSSSFKIMGYTIKIDPKQIFGLKDPVNSLFIIERGSYKKDIYLELEIESQDELKPYHKQYYLEFPKERQFWCFSKKLDPMPYGNYLLIVKLLGENNSILDKKEKNFQISFRSNVLHPPMVSKTLKKKNRFLFYFITASQYEQVKQFSQAEKYYEKAFNLNNSYIDLIKTYASFLLEQKKYDKMLTVTENLKGQDKEKFFYHSLKGRALYFKKDYYSAVDALLEANKVYDSDTVVLNTLGFALIHINKKEEAIKVLSSSLKIHKDQKNIEKILSKLKQEINKGRKR